MTSDAPQIPRANRARWLSAPISKYPEVSVGAQPSDLARAPRIHVAPIMSLRLPPASTIHGVRADGTSRVAHLSRTAKSGYLILSRHTPTRRVGDSRCRFQEAEIAQLRRDSLSPSESVQLGNGRRAGIRISGRQKGPSAYSERKKGISALAE